MKTYQLYKEQYLPISLKEAWDFFSSAGNLSKITPAEMDFKILTKLTGEPIYAGMHIDYIVKPLLGIPMKWTTEISKVDAGKSFTDKQIKGPYALWEHTHTFTAVKGGVFMTDTVLYAVPLGWLGQIARELIVKAKLEDIFKFRETKLVSLFGQYQA